jgi:hypothetical protein
VAHKAAAAWVHVAAAREWACGAEVRRRYLDAANGDPWGAAPCLAATCEWRARHGVDSLLDDPRAVALERRHRPLLKYDYMCSHICHDLQSKHLYLSFIRFL